MKGNKKGFCNHISSKSKTRENFSLLLNEMVDLLTKDMKKYEVVKVFFTLVFTHKIQFPHHESQAFETCWKKSRKNNNFPLLEEDQVKEHLNKLNTLKPMGPYGIHSQVLRELVSVIARTLFIIFERSWRLGGGMACLRSGARGAGMGEAVVTSIFKKDKENDSGNHRSGKMIVQIILEAISKVLTESSQCRFTERK